MERDSGGCVLKAPPPLAQSPRAAPHILIFLCDGWHRLDRRFFSPRCINTDPTMEIYGSW